MTKTTIKYSESKGLSPITTKYASHCKSCNVTTLTNELRNFCPRCDSGRLKHIVQTDYEP